MDSDTWQQASCDGTSVIWLSEATCTGGRASIMRQAAVRWLVTGDRLEMALMWGGRSSQ